MNYLLGLLQNPRCLLGPIGHHRCPQMFMMDPLVIHLLKPVKYLVNLLDLVVILIEEMAVVMATDASFATNVKFVHFLTLKVDALRGVIVLFCTAEAVHKPGLLEIFTAARTMVALICALVDNVVNVIIAVNQEDGRVIFAPNASTTHALEGDVEIVIYQPKEDPARTRDNDGLVDMDMLLTEDLFAGFHTP